MGPLSHMDNIEELDRIEIGLPGSDDKSKTATTDHATERSANSIGNDIIGAHQNSQTVEGWRLAVLTFGVSVGLFLAMLDTSIIATALYDIELDLHSSHPVTWVALSYTLAYLGCAVHFARLADVLGRFNAEIIALVTFVAFSLGCGFATSLEALVALRTLQGIAGSGLYSLAMIILPEICPARLQAMIGGVIGLVVTVSGILGPVLGGIITQKATWRWIFFMNAPIGVLALVLLLLAWPRTLKSKPVDSHAIAEFDILGGILLIAASVLVVFSFQEAGLGDSTRVWTSAIFLAPLIIGCLCWPLLFWWEYVAERVTSVRPLLPTTLLTRRVYVSAVLSTITMGFVYFVAIYSLPTHFQVVYQRSSLSAGLSLLPMLVSGAVGTVIGGTIYMKPWTMFPGLLFACAIMAIGVGLLSTVSSLEFSNRIYGFQVLVGLGFGLTVTNVTMLAVTQSSSAERAVAQGIIAQARVLGGSLGIAASTAILGTMMQRHAPEFDNTTRTDNSGLSASGPSEGFVVLQHAYAEAFRLTMQVTAAVACISLLFSLGTWAGRNPTGIVAIDEKTRVPETNNEQSTT